MQYQLGHMYNICSVAAGTHGAQPDVKVEESGFKIQANGSGWIVLPQSVRNIRELAWRCVQVLWCGYYSKLKHLKEFYMLYRQFSAHVAYFWVSPKHRSILVHYQRSSPVYKLCVSTHPHERVIARNGFHASHGHTAMVCFGDGGIIRMKCFDNECTQKCASVFGDTLDLQVPENVRFQAGVAFHALQNEERDAAT
jgi:hypothetical protein